jgi:vitamin B12 transporter
VRRDDYDTAGAATPFRFGAAQHFASGTKLHATYGTAFTAPGLEDRYGSAFQPANPAIRPERSRGWDAGVDQTLFAGKLTLSATYFNNRYNGKFGYDSSFATINVNRARADGVELSADGRWSGWTARVGQTFTNSEDESNGAPLLRRPRSIFTATLEREITPSITVGAGLSSIADREDLDPVTYVQVAAPDYTVVRVYGAWIVRKNLRVTARLENLLDEKYQAVLGYPALPFGAFGGVEWTF